MKKIIILLLCLVSIKLVAQNIGINATGALPNASAILDVSASDKGMLVPRTSTTSRLAIINPAKGLILYDTTTSSFWFHNGSAWTQLSAAGNGWNLTGNAATNPSTNFVGTTDDEPLIFKIRNVKSGMIDSTSGNTALGYTSLFSNTTGFNNVASGYAALYYNTTGFANTANGYQALAFNSSGIFNTSSGNEALYSNTTGSRNTATGAFALALNTTGDRNTSTGTDALYYNSSGYDNTATGVSALVRNSTGHHNTAFGGSALFYNTTGSFNSANGYAALFSNTTGDYNAANGMYALRYNTSGGQNTANGYAALYSNTTGNSNIANGYGALQNNTVGSFNYANGFEALYFNTTGNANSAYGYHALYSNTSGGGNTAYGNAALISNNTGSNNIANGIGALRNNTTGDNNIAIGINALSNNSGGNNNIAIGYSSGTSPSTPNIYNTISIGNDDILNAYQNQVFIGNTSTAFIGGKVPWSVISDARVKNTITEDVKGLDFIVRLRPVTYHVSNNAITSISGNKKTPDFPGKYDGEKIKYTGFLAQEVEMAAKAANYDFSGYAAPKNQWGFYTISYEQFVVPLVKAVQEQQVIIETQQKQIDLLEKRLTVLETK